MSYSKILGALDIDSGHLSYHLENLGELLTHSSEGQYKLSSIGNAATKLMGGVEEKSINDSTLSPKRKNFNNVVVASFVLLAVTLFFSSLFLAFIPQDQSSIDKSYPQSVPLNGTINYNISITYITNPFETGLSSIGYSGLGYFYIEAETPVHDLTHRVGDYIGFTLELNGTASYRIRVYNPNNQLMGELVYPSFYSISSFINETGTSISNIVPFGKGTFYIYIGNKPGTYKISIEWIKTDQAYGAIITFNHLRNWVKWPLFYNGILGIHMSTISPLILIILWKRMNPETVYKQKRKLVLLAFSIIALALFLVWVLILVIYFTIL